MNSKFNDKDYSSNDGMLTYVWGPPFWHFLHTMSFNYPIEPTPDDQNKYSIFIHSIGFVLPCRYCRENFYKNLKSIKFGEKDFENRDTFSKMIYNLHNAVNIQLGKTNVINYDEVRNRYEHFRSRCNMKEYVKENKTSKKKEKGCTQPDKDLKKVCTVLTVQPWNKDMKNSIIINDDCGIQSLTSK